MLPGPSQPITVDIQVNRAMADHQPQALGWGEGCKGEGLLGDRDGTWGPSGDRGGSGGHLEGECGDEGNRKDRFDNSAVC